MKPEDRKVAYRKAHDMAEAVNFTIENADIELDADPDTGDGFDPVVDGVWVRAWVKVPQEAIPGYQLVTSPASTVETIPPVHWPFPTKS